MIKRLVSRRGPSARGISERRAEGRLLCSDLIELCWITRSGFRRSEMAIIEDFSGSGASLFLGVAVAPMTDVTLHTGRRTLQGVIRYCSPQPNGHVVGIEFDPCCRAESFIPEHLLDITRLDFTPEDK